MKTASIIAIIIFACITVCFSIPAVKQQAEVKAGIDTYNDFLADLFSGLAETTFGSLSNFLNQLINEDLLNTGKQGIDPSRIDIFSFLYDNILQDMFSGIVTNTFTTISDTLNNMIQTNPLGIGKRSTTNDLVARIDVFSFLYDNILQDMLSGIVTNTFTTISDTLNNIIQTNPLGIGKRSNELNVNILQFVHDKIIVELFSSLTSDTANYLLNSLNNLVNKLIANLGQHSVNIQQVKTIVAETVSKLIHKFKTFAHQAAASWNDKQKLKKIIRENIANIKDTIAQSAQQLSQLIPSTIATEVSDVLATLQSVLVLWTNGFGGSLGPVIGPFQS